jgi:hypothetical protein
MGEMLIAQLVPGRDLYLDHFLEENDDGYLLLARE